MNTTFQNSAQVLSIGIFFTLMIVGLIVVPARTASTTGSSRHGVPAAAADRAAHLPPVSTLFAAFLGYDPVAHLIGAHDPRPICRPPSRRVLTGRSFFPS